MVRLFANLILTATILCAGCTSTASKEPTSPVVQQLPQPEWVKGSSDQWPRRDYLVTRAHAPTLEQATENAKEQLSRYFLIDIDAVGLSIHQAALASGYELNKTFSSERKQVVAAPESARVLEKITIADQWHDIANNTHYVIAILPRNTSRGYLLTQIQTLDKNTEEYLKKARETEDLVTKMGIQARAWRAQQIRQKLSQSLQKIDLTGRTMKSRFDLEKMEQDLLKQVTVLKIYPTGLEEEMNARQITTMLTGGLRVAGLKPADEKRADYILRATLDVSIVGERNGWAVGRGEMQIVLADKKSGKPHGSKKWEIEVPGIDEDAAKRRVVEKTEYMLKKDMRNILIDIAME